MFEIFAAVGLFAAGYAFRGAIGREVKKLGADVKAELAVALADLKAEAKKL